MDHTHIVTVNDLDRYSDTRDSEAVIPELIYWLVKQSEPPPYVCRIPYGDKVNQPGWDGIVEIEESFLEFVPKGKSYWEISTERNPQNKATEDFKKRTAAITKADRSQASFVFVTPRSSASGGWNEPGQTRWKEKRKDRGWKRIHIIDGDKLADWVREFPAIGRWIAKKIGIASNLGAITTPSEHWDLICLEGDKSDPPLPAKLFTLGRDNAYEALQKLFEDTSQTPLLLFAESRQDVADFVAAYLETIDLEMAQNYTNRCLYINEEDAWLSVVELRTSHVLVADPQLGLETDAGSHLLSKARQKGHAVIIPLCGAWSGNNPEIIKLRSPTQSQIEAVLNEAGYPEIRAQELARAGGDRLSALRRHLQGLGTLPPYANWENADRFAQAGLAGKWDAKNQADRSALEMLQGKGYGEWIETLRPDVIRSDSPLIQSDEKWRFVARGEAWNALGNRITDDDLDRLEETAVVVLGERDPQFDLPKEERYAAAIHNKTLKHSSLLREGLAETLALVGSRPKFLSSCSLHKAENTANRVVRCLLRNASWDQWSSLDLLLPLLAEAAPDEFLKAVELALVDLKNTPFHEIFAQEGSGSFDGGTYISGLLWALEGLVWNPDYLSRVALILADLASIDPGGNWGNRPANSLATIFIPWLVQTVASFEERKTAVKTVLREQPLIGWHLLLSLLPHSHEFTSGCHRPTWQEYIPRDWKNSVLLSEYWEQITAYTELAIDLGKKDTEKLGELINRLSDLSEPAQERILLHLTSEEVVALPEAERLPIWEKLESLVRHHRRFSDADWALPEEVVKKIEETANALVPQAPELKYHYLFSDRDFDLFDENSDYDEQQKRLDEARQSAVKTIFETGGLPAVLAFAQSVPAPYEVGRALGVIAPTEVEDEILPTQLNTEDETMRQVVAGFVWMRYRELKWTWVDAVLKRNWNAEQKATFLMLLPFEEKVWHRVSVHLGKQNEKLYWQKTRVGFDQNPTIAIQKFLKYGRANAAVECISRTAIYDNQFDVSLATEALLALLEASSAPDQLDYYTTVELIKRLQKSPDTDQDALFKIEWHFLPWLDRFSSGSPITLEKHLASDPAFFAEIVKIVFHSKNDEEEDVEPDEQKQNFGRNAYNLLREWKKCPGTLPDGTLDVDAFNTWINEARRITEETGHGEVAQLQIGHILTHAPADLDGPDGLWIHEAVASVLDGRDAEEMRSGFTTELFNQRGVYSYTAGREERELAQLNHDKAKAIRSKGYSRFADAMREFAERYEREAEREAERDIFYD